MTRFEYAAIFYGILVAMAIEIVAARVHRLLAAGKRVRWHWMAPATAINSSLVVLGEFWILWSDRNQWTGTYSFFEFLPSAIGVTLMFLTAAATLPDEVPEAGLDLKTFYFDNRRHYWGLVGAYFAFNIVLNVVNLVRFGPNAVWQENLRWMIGDFVGLGTAGLLFAFRTYWVHAVGIAFGLISLLFFLDAIRFS